MSVHRPREPVKASTVRQLSARNMPFPHITGVLAAAGVLADDRPDTLAIWLDEQLAGLPGEYRRRAGRLARPAPLWRAPPQATQSKEVAGISSIRTFLAGTGARYLTLRQVTRDDITAWLAGRPGRSRPQDASTLRGLFTVLKAERLIFANPARGIRVSRRNPSVPAPLPVTGHRRGRRRSPRQSRAAGGGALAGVHALLPGQIRHLRLDQAGLAGRRLDPGGLDRPLDDFTATAISGYLAFRCQRWPLTASPYLLVTRKTAHTGEPARAGTG